MQQAMQQQGQQLGQQLLCLYVYFLIFEGPVTGIEVIQRTQQFC